MSLTLEIESLLTGISNICIGNKPSSPDNVVVIYNTGGYAREVTPDAPERPSFMVLIRNTSYSSGEALANQIKDLLHMKKTAKVLGILQQGDINDIGRDENGRAEFTVNFNTFYAR